MMKAVKRIARNYKKFTVADKVELYLTLLGIVLVGWLIVSWLEIGFNSLEYGYEYSPMNLLVMIFDAFDSVPR